LQLAIGKLDKARRAVHPSRRAAGRHLVRDQSRGVQGYEQLGNSFDAAQGGIFGARFDNELLGAL